MSFGRARSVQPLVHFYSKWHDAPFSVFSSIFDKSTSHCNEWCSVKVRCRYVNPATKRCARSFCIQVAHSQGHLTLGFKNSPVGRFVVLCAPILSGMRAERWYSDENDVRGLRWRFTDSQPFTNTVQRKNGKPALKLPFTNDDRCWIDAWKQIRFVKIDDQRSTLNKKTVSWCQNALF